MPQRTEPRALSRRTNLRRDARIASRGGCVSDTQCDDGNVCNGLETCLAGACQRGPALRCDDGVSCTEDRCDPMVGCQTIPRNESATIASRAPKTAATWRLGAVVNAVVDRDRDGFPAHVLRRRRL